MARVTTRAPHNVRCSYSGRQKVCVRLSIVIVTLHAFSCFCRLCYWATLYPGVHSRWRSWTAQTPRRRRRWSNNIVIVPTFRFRRWSPSCRCTRSRRRWRGSDFRWPTLVGVRRRPSSSSSPPRMTTSSGSPPTPSASSKRCFRADRSTSSISAAASSTSENTKSCSLNFITDKIQTYKGEITLI